MLFLVGRTDLRLISPDRKQILLHKNLHDVVLCIQVNNSALDVYRCLRDLKENRGISKASNIMIEVRFVFR